MDNMKVLHQINSYLTDLGTIIAGIIVSFLALVFSLFPGLVLTYFMLKTLWFFMGEEEFIPLDKIILYSILGIASLYVGIGMSEFIETPKEK